MMRRSILLVPSAFAFLSLAAQQPAAKAPVAPAVPAPAAGTSAALEEELLVIKATTYQPKLIRDPFSAPTDVENASKGDLIDDIAVKGRIVSNGKVLAVVADSRGNV